MLETTGLLTPNEMAYALEIHATTLNILTLNSSIPRVYVQHPDSGISDIRFNPDAVAEWLQTSPNIQSANKKVKLDNLRSQYQTISPTTSTELKIYNNQFAPKRATKGYSLEIVPNKKLGWVYYVRYTDNKKPVYSRWCTHTNNKDAADRFAIENKEKILTAYYTRKKARKPYNGLYAIFSQYYAKNSIYLQDDRDDGRDISEEARISYHNFVTKQFIPFLKKERVQTIEQIDTQLLLKLRRRLRNGITKKDGTVVKPGIRPQTVNHYMSHISTIFNRLVLVKLVNANPCQNIKPIKIRKGDEKITGCYKTDRLKGVFNKRWRDELSLLLNLIIYTTNMRNGEIERIQVKDIVVKGNIHFIDIPESKSESGVRIVPLHDFVYRKLSAYIKKHNKRADDYPFKLPGCKRLGSRRYKKAYTELAKHTKYTEDELKQENMHFYSGRHFWKTLMNENGLGDAEEVFMGHKTSPTVEERYNHLDKQGLKRKVRKAREVFAVLDRCVFTH